MAFHAFHTLSLPWPAVRSGDAGFRATSSALMTYRFARYTLPPLTSVRMSRLDLAGAAVEALRNLIEGKSSRRSVQPAVATELVVRRSHVLISHLPGFGRFRR